MHAFLGVLPVVAVLLLGVLGSEQWHPATALAVKWRSPAIAPAMTATVIGSFVVLAGLPVFEELFRTTRSRSKGWAAKSLESEGIHEH